VRVGEREDPARELDDAEIHAELAAEIGHAALAGELHGVDVSVRRLDRSGGPDDAIRVLEMVEHAVFLDRVRTDPGHLEVRTGTSRSLETGRDHCVSGILGVEAPDHTHKHGLGPPKESSDRKVPANARMKSGCERPTFSALLAKGVKRNRIVDGGRRGCDIAGMPRPIDPIALFRRHLGAARRGAGEDESDAMTLSTIGPRGQPRSRVVLLRGLDARGFMFFTNLESAKGREIAGASKVALCFHWPRIKTQVRVEGRASKVTKAEADAYFASRARDSQIAAWASDQSRPIRSREELMRRFAAFARKFDGVAVPRRPHWSGFRVAPAAIEFWYGRPHRLHERQLFTRAGKRWRQVLLSP
jgi:pyridoxamine 5'-phosphate oxidase